MREYSIALEHHVNRALVWRDVRHILPVDQNLPLGWQLETGDHPEQRGFAATRWAEQNKELTRQNVEADIIDSGNLAEAFGDVADLDDWGFGLGFGHYNNPIKSVRVERRRDTPRSRTPYGPLVSARGEREARKCSSGQGCLSSMRRRNAFGTLHLQGNGSQDNGQYDQ